MGARTSSMATAFQDLRIIGSPLVMVPQLSLDRLAPAGTTPGEPIGVLAAADMERLRRTHRQDACEVGRVSRCRHLDAHTFLGMERNAAFGGMGRTNMRPPVPRAP